MRLILSRDQIGRQAFYHGSGSIVSDDAASTAMLQAAKRLFYRDGTYDPMIVPWFVEQVRLRLVELTGRAEWKLSGISEGKGVPHFEIPE